MTSHPPGTDANRHQERSAVISLIVKVAVFALVPIAAALITVAFVLD